MGIEQKGQFVNRACNRILGRGAETSAAFGTKSQREHCESDVQNVRHLAGNVHDNRTVRSQRFQGRDYAEPVRQRSMLQAILETKRGQTVPGGNRTAHKTGYVCATIRAGAKATENGRTLLALRRVRRALDSGV